MKLKKVLACLLAGTMVMSMATVMTAGAASDEDNKLTVWTWDPNFNIYAINKAAEIYAKDHEGFTVEVTEVKSNDIETKITNAVQAGDLSTLPGGAAYRACEGRRAVSHHAFSIYRRPQYESGAGCPDQGVAPRDGEVLL